MKAYIEIALPESCSWCPLRYIHTDYNDNEKIGCAFLNCDVTENFDNRRHDCPLKTIEHIGYEDHIRIGNESDALRLLEEMVYKCKTVKPRPDYNNLEKQLFKIGTLNHDYFLPRLEALKDALERNLF